MAPDPGPACAACGARDLRLRHRVAGEAGQAGLIPTTDRYGTALGDLLLCSAVMAGVAEHRLAPGRALARVRGWLGPEGVLCLMLPDAGSRVARAMGRRWWSVLPTHVQYFTRHSLAVLLGRHGFDVLAQTTAPKAFTVGYYLRRTSGYSEGLSAALVAGSRALGLADRLWAPDFGDRMLTVARRAPQSAAERPRSDARSA